MRKTKLDVLGVDFSVRLVEQLGVEDGETIWGEIDFEALEIRLRTKPSAVHVRTLLHELLHAIFGTNPALKLLLKREKYEEAFCDAFAVPLADILVRNGLLTDMAWLFQETDDDA